ncbi:MAG: ketoacyl-ACP synthase III [Myxococcales bacterium]|nr:ketoacyl-ACP synthase III [Myxococcales bacterium]
MALYVHGLGHAHPDNEISNRFLEELDIGTSDEWIMERVGIRSRRSVLPLDYIRATRNRDLRAGREAAELDNAQLTARAARQAIERAGIEPADVGLMITGSSAADDLCPANACGVARELELEIPAFDIQSACTSFYVQLWLLSQMREDALPDYVLVSGCDTLTTTVDYTDRNSAVLWGDGAAAAVISLRHPACAQVLGNTLESSPAGYAKVLVPRQGHFSQEGRAVQMFGIKRMSACVRGLHEAYASTDRDFHFVGHQANLRMLESVRAQCEIPTDRHHTNAEWFGNTGAASAASVISMLWDKWDSRDDIAVAGVGGGLSWSSYLLRFAGKP